MKGEHVPFCWRLFGMLSSFILVSQSATIVMFGCDYAYRAPLFNQVHPFVGLISACREALQLRYNLRRISSYCKTPAFVYAFHGIDSPVNKDAQLASLNHCILALVSILRRV